MLLKERSILQTWKHLERTIDVHVHKDSTTVASLAVSPLPFSEDSTPLPWSPFLSSSLPLPLFSLLLASILNLCFVVFIFFNFVS